MGTGGGVPRTGLAEAGASEALWRGATRTVGRQAHAAGSAGPRFVPGAPRCVPQQPRDLLRPETRGRLPPSWGSRPSGRVPSLTDAAQEPPDRRLGRRLCTPGLPGSPSARRARIAPAATVLSLS